jgi:hypothetical protein
MPAACCTECWECRRPIAAAWSTACSRGCSPRSRRSCSPEAEGTEDLPGYLSLALRAAFPELSYRDVGGRGRREWRRAHLRQLVARDAGGRDVDRPCRCFAALAACTATTPLDAILAQAAGLNRATAVPVSTLRA